MRRSKLLFLVALLAPLTLPAQEIPGKPPAIAPGATPDPAHLKHVVLLDTGGPIAERAPERIDVAWPDGSLTGKPQPTFGPEVWLRDLPELQNLARLTPVDAREPSGDNDSLPALQHLAARLRTLAADPAVDAIVVAHGSNTLAEAAFLANLTVPTDKPVVFTTALRPWNALSGDGPLNLWDAIRVAVHPDAASKGVLVVTNQYVDAARDVAKMSVFRVEAMRGIDTGALGVADPDKVKFYREPVRLHTTGSAFATAATPTSLPRVDIVYAYASAPADAIADAVRHGAKGLVIDGFADGLLTPDEARAVHEAQAHGILIVTTSRTRSGRVQLTPERTRTHILAGDNLPPEKARLLLSLALTQTHDPAALQQIFNTY